MDNIRKRSKITQQGNINLLRITTFFKKCFNVVDLNELKTIVDDFDKTSEEMEVVNEFRQSYTYIHTYIHIF